MQYTKFILLLLSSDTWKMSIAFGKILALEWLLYHGIIKRLITLRNKNKFLFVIPEFKNGKDILCHKVSEIQANILILPTFLTTQWWIILTHLESKEWWFSAIFFLCSIPLNGSTVLNHDLPCYLFSIAEISWWKCSPCLLFTVPKFFR